VDGLFFVSSGQSAALLVPAHHTLDPIASPVQPTTESLLSRLVRPRGDHLCHTTLPQPLPNPWVAIPLVASQPTRPPAAAFAPRQNHSQQHRFDPLAVVGLPSREVHRQQGAATITDQMHFRPEAAPRTPQRMILRLLELRRLCSTEAGPHLRIFFSPPRLPGWRG